MVKYAAIVVNRKAAALDRVFHYGIPASMSIERGMIAEVPFGTQKLEGVVVDIVDEVDFDNAKIKNIIRTLSEKPVLTDDLLFLARYLADYYLTTFVSVVQAMLPASMALTGRLPAGSTIKQLYALKYIIEGRKAPKSQAILDYLVKHPGITPLELQKAVRATSAQIKNLKNKGYIEVKESVWWQEKSIVVPQKPHQLNADQISALVAIEAEFNSSERPILLQGVTGSGKTEIYLQMAERTIGLGQDVIVLVPEIALTPQTVSVFMQRLKTKIAVLHSGLTAAERRKTWQAIADGRYPVVIGARSAIFAPMPNLGLVVMDEEHEVSYKQENNPRFNARIAALKRCSLTSAHLIMGSATPDLVSYYKAQNGEYKLVELPHRVNERELAQIQIVDMAQELKEGNNSVFSSLLAKELEKNWRQSEQSLLFLNRRGFDTFVSCRHCGYVVECPHCSVSMAYHPQEGKLKCHYCGRMLTPPQTCPVCGSSAIRYFGAGTQKIAAAAKKLLPEAKIARMDRDSVTEKGAYEAVYKAMLDGKTDILVGTQMVAKGLDFPNLTLVGVVAADTSLNLPEYRSGERTFQLIAQVAGRSGRHKPGRVIVQTYNPEHSVIKAAVRQDYKNFYEEELERRSLFGYPPYGDFIRLVLSSTDKTLLEDAERRLSSALEILRGDKYVILGPSACPREKIKDRYRHQLVLKGSNLGIMRKDVKKALEQLVAEKQLNKKVMVAIDVEPITMM
jgi:primosomal protein N' (replication factor Y)